MGIVIPTSVTSFFIATITIGAIITVMTAFILLLVSIIAGVTSS